MSSRVLEWARRRAGVEHTQRWLDTQSDGRSGLPPVWVESLRSFYELLQPTHKLVCEGTACAFAGPRAQGDRVYCLGRCYEAPATTARSGQPIPRRALVDPPVVLRHLLGNPNASSVLQDYQLPSGEEILQAVLRSGLKGRGGAAFPTGAKWQAARDTAAVDRYVVANGDEGDPGSYVDRLLMEEAPHSILAGMVACARVIGAGRGIVLIRAEYPLALERVRQAVSEATAAGLLGDLHIEVMSGAGSYVAGEETALLRCLEGLRAEPWPKPPYPAQQGLHGLPTVVQNVETLAVIPWLVGQGGLSDTKAVCLSGAVLKPGVLEVRLGTPLTTVLEAAGGAPPGRPWKMALVGGPMGTVIPVHDFGVPLSFEGMPGLGHGGIVLLDESVSAGKLAEHLFHFARNESCGACTPCRVGTAQLAHCHDRSRFERLLQTLEEGSMCGFGLGVPRPLRDLLRHFPEELFPCT